MLKAIGKLWYAMRFMASALLDEVRIIGDFTLRRPLRAAIFGFVFIFMGLNFYVRVVPQQLTIMAGPNGGVFWFVADTVARRLTAEYHVAVKVIQREDTLRIIDAVDDPASDVSIGFIAQDVKSPPRHNVMQLGSVLMETMFAFVRTGGGILAFPDLKGRRIAVGLPESGPRVVTDQILREYGVNDATAQFVPMEHEDIVKALLDGSVDAGIFLVPKQSPLLTRLGPDTGLTPLPLVENTAMAGHLKFVTPLAVARGSFSLDPISPAADLASVAVPVTVIAKNTLSPGISIAVALILKDVFNQFDTERDMPTMDLVHDLRPDPLALDVYRHELGYVPILFKLFPFGMANWLQANFKILTAIATAFVIYGYLGLPKPIVWLVWLRKENLTKRLANLVARSEKGELDDIQIHRMRNLFRALKDDYQDKRKYLEALQRMETRVQRTGTTLALETPEVIPPHLSH